MPILEGADVRLNYFVAGEGPPVTLLHGFTQSGRSWQEVIDTMPAGWRWGAPAPRGHGEARVAPGAPGTPEPRPADPGPLWDHPAIHRRLPTPLVWPSVGRPPAFAPDPRAPA